METTFNAESRKLNVVLRSNYLATGDGPAFVGRVQRMADTITTENLISHIQEHETSVRPLTIQYCAGLLKTEILSLLAQGNAVNVLDLCTLYIALDGGVGGRDPSGADVPSFVVRCTPSATARAVTEGIAVGSVAKSESGTRINAITDLYTGKDNSVITPHRSLRVSGSRLRIAGADGANGIYLVPVADPATRIRVPDSFVTRNEPKTLEFFVPDALVSGESYFIELVSQFAGGATELKEPRSFRSGFSLTVA